MITTRPMQAVQCDACGAERIGPVIDAVPGFHIHVTEVRAGGDWRCATVFLCCRRCAGKNVASALDDEEWLSAEELLQSADYTAEYGTAQDKDGAGDTTTAEEPDHAVRLATDG